MNCIFTWNMSAVYGLCGMISGINVSSKYASPACSGFIALWKGGPSGRTSFLVELISNSERALPNFFQNPIRQKKHRDVTPRVVRISHFTVIASKLWHTWAASQICLNFLTHTTPREFLVHWLCIGSLRVGGGKVLSGKVPFAFALRFSFTAQSDPATLLSLLSSPVSQPVKTIHTNIISCCMKRSQQTRSKMFLSQ